MTTVALEKTGSLGDISKAYEALQSLLEDANFREVKTTFVTPQKRLFSPHIETAVYMGKARTIVIRKVNQQVYPFKNSIGVEVIADSKPDVDATLKLVKSQLDEILNNTSTEGQEILDWTYEQDGAD